MGTTFSHNPMLTPWASSSWESNLEWSTDPGPRVDFFLDEGGASLGEQDADLTFCHFHNRRPPPSSKLLSLPECSPRGPPPFQTHTSMGGPLCVFR